MKKLLSLLFVFTLVACGGEDDDTDENNEINSPQRTLTIGNENFTLLSGVIDNGYPVWRTNNERDTNCPSNYFFTIILFEESISLENNSSIRSGSGKLIYLDIISNEQSPNNGEYSDVTDFTNSTLNQNFTRYSDIDSDSDFLYNWDYSDGACYDLDFQVEYRFIGDINNGEYQTGEEFSFLGGNLQMSKSSSNEYTIVLSGATTDETNLPVNLNFTGYLATMPSYNFQFP